jgi:hypothetical protein
MLFMSSMTVCRLSSVLVLHIAKVRAHLERLAVAGGVPASDCTDLLVKTACQFVSKSNDGSAGRGVVRVAGMKPSR